MDQEKTKANTSVIPLASRPHKQKARAAEKGVMVH